MKRVFILTVVVMVTTLCTAALFFVSGCGEKNPNSNPTISAIPNDSLYSSRQDPPTQLDSTNNSRQQQPSALSTTAYTYILWPFVSDKSFWRGWSGSRSGGGYVSACGSSSVWSHSGADYNARDLSRLDGSSYGRFINSGMSGLVLKAGWDGCYGNSVCIYDASRDLVLRYAHLGGIYVKVGQYIPGATCIGWVGNTGCGSFASHLHLVAYENVKPDSKGVVRVPTMCNSDYYSCQIYFIYP